MSDPLEGQEITIINQLLAKVWPKASEGDERAQDRVIKLLQLKRAYQGEPEQEYRKDGTWDG